MQTKHEQHRRRDIAKGLLPLTKGLAYRRCPHAKQHENRRDAQRKEHGLQHQSALRTGGDFIVAAQF